MKWLKIVENWAWGQTQPDYTPLWSQDPADENIEIASIIEFRENAADYSDKFRGVEFEIIRTSELPEGVLDNQIKLFESYYKSNASRLHTLYSEKNTNKEYKSATIEIEAKIVDGE